MVERAVQHSTYWQPASPGDRSVSVSVLKRFSQQQSHIAAGSPARRRKQKLNKLSASFRLLAAAQDAQRLIDRGVGCRINGNGAALRPGCQGLRNDGRIHVSCLRELKRLSHILSENNLLFHGFPKVLAFQSLTRSEAIGCVFRIGNGNAVGWRAWLNRQGS